MLFTRQAGTRSRSASPKKHTRAQTSPTAPDDGAESTPRLPKRRRTASDPTSLSVLQRIQSVEDSTSACGLQVSSTRSSPSTVLSDNNCRGEQKRWDSGVFDSDSESEPDTRESRDRLTDLRQKTLAYERKRSDPDGKWAAEQK